MADSSSLMAIRLSIVPAGEAAISESARTAAVMGPPSWLNWYFNPLGNILTIPVQKVE
jgi:hypothetical protein